MNFIGIIPARYNSTRFPGKPLVDINGKPMIQRVYEAVEGSQLMSDVYVATDDTRIEDVVKNFGGNVVMTSPNHRTGTERCFEAFQKINKDGKYQPYDAVINIQGDEPYINTEQIKKIIYCFDDNRTLIATLIKQITDKEDLFNHNVVKVIKTTANKLIYFSRHPIPYSRDKAPSEWLEHTKYYKHIGIYAYKVSAFSTIVNLPESMLEKAENLEQLRWVENGFKIRFNYTMHDSISIDTPEDLEKIKQLK